MNEKLDIENVFIDLDGTSLKDDKTISKNTLLALDKLKENNVNVFVATGRPHYMIKEEMSILDTHNEVISVNGGLIFDFQTRKIVFSSPFNVDVLSKLTHFLLDENLPFVLYSEKNMIHNLDKNKSKWYKYIQNKIDNTKDEFKWEFIKIDSKKFSLSQKIIKILIIEDEMLESDQKKLLSFLSEINDIEYLKSQIGVLDIMPKGNSKGNAINYFEKTYNLNLDKSLAFGDAFNDVSMFKKVKYSVAMKNSLEGVKEKATFVTSSNDNDGIFFFLTNKKII